MRWPRARRTARWKRCTKAGCSTNINGHAPGTDLEPELRRECLRLRARGTGLAGPLEQPDARDAPLGDLADDVDRGGRRHHDDGPVEPAGDVEEAGVARVAGHRAARRMHSHDLDPLVTQCLVDIPSEVATSVGCADDRQSTRPEEVGRGLDRDRGDGLVGHGGSSRVVCIDGTTGPGIGTEAKVPPHWADALRGRERDHPRVRAQRCRRAAPARHGPRRPAHRLARRAGAGADGPRVRRHPLRQPRHRPELGVRLGTPVARARLRRPPAAPSGADRLRDRRHGRRRRRPARRPRDRAGARGRCLDGRDDRPGPRHPAPDAGGQPHLDHVEPRGRQRRCHRQGAAGVRSAARAVAARPRWSRRSPPSA